jgi:hypothetical protein
MPDDAPAKPLEGDYDVLMATGKTDDGDGTKVVRARPGRVEAGEMRTMKEGQPLVAGEVVTLEQRKDAPQLFNVKVEHTVKPAAAKATHHGPAQVATDEYRDSWERTFGARRSQLN